MLRLAAPGLPPSQRGLAISTDSNPRWCALDPRRGTAMTVAESALNVACAGARPVALVNCLNFGNPEHPEVMWQLSESVDGMAEACRALHIPVIGGNVSLYNASGGQRHRPHAGGGRAGRHRPTSSADHRGWASRRGRPSCSWVTIDPSVWPARAGPSSATVTAGGRCRLSTSPPTRAFWAWWYGLVSERGNAHLRARRVGRRAGAGAGRGCGALRGWAAVVDGVADHAELFSESPSRVVLGTDRPDEVLAAGTGGRRPGARHRVGGRRPGGGRPVSSTWPSPTPPTRGAWRCPARWARPSPSPEPRHVRRRALTVSRLHPARRRRDDPTRIVGDLPGVAVGIDEHARVPAPEGRARLPCRWSPPPPGLRR